MEQEMVNTPVDNAPMPSKFKQELVEDTCLTKAADLAAKQHELLASDVTDAWKRPQLKVVWCPGQWRACHGCPCHVPRRGRF